MKKGTILSVIMTIFLCCTAFPSVQAKGVQPKELSVVKSLQYAPSDYRGKEPLEAMKEKLKPFDIPEAVIRHLPQSKLQKLSEATEISVQSSYYIEPLLPYQPLVQVDQATYRAALKKDQIAKAESERRLQAGAASQASIVLDPSEGLFTDVNGGKLNLMLLLGSADRVNYVMMAIAQWESLPLFRGKDAFGLTRDTDTKVNEQSASGGYSYFYQIRRPDNTYEDREEFHEVPYVDLAQDKNNHGYAYEFRLLSDIPSSDDALRPTTRHTQVAAFVTYDGYVASSDVRGVNHWATYAHQNIKIVFDPSFHFDVPFSGGFSMTFGFAWAYTQKCDEHNWRI